MLSDLEGQNQVLPASLQALSYTNARHGVCTLHPAPSTLHHAHREAFDTIVSL